MYNQKKKHFDVPYLLELYANPLAENQKRT